MYEENRSSLSSLINQYYDWGGGVSVSLYP